VKAIVMAPQHRSRTWLWFYIVLAMLTAIALIIPLIVLPRLHGLDPLTEARFSAARALWEKNGPRDYDLEYRKKGAVTGSFAVQVRDDKAVAVLLDGQPLDRTSNPKLYDYYTMPAIFNDLERFLELAGKQKNPPAILRASFDPVDGHVIRYFYSTSSPPQQIEINVDLRLPAR
jgi:Family of unknown function (DUF6174)